MNARERSSALNEAFVSLMGIVVSCSRIHMLCVSIFTWCWQGGVIGGSSMWHADLFVASIDWTLMQKSPFMIQGKSSK